jgi:hypothetical protein
VTVRRHAEPGFVNRDSMRFLIAPDSSTGLHFRKERRVLLRVRQEIRMTSGSLMIADSLESLGCLVDDIRVSAGCGFA